MKWLPDTFEEWWPWLGGGAAAIAASLAMWLLRASLQVRSVPERMLEWSLLFVPLDVFESLLQRFGFSAKRYALYFGVVLLLALLVWLGATAIRRRWSMPTILALGLGLWLITMLVVMPLTGAGVFASALLEGMRTTVLGYLAVGLIYAGVLIVWQRAPALPTDSPSRRWALAVMGGSAGVLAVTYLLDALLPHRTGLPTIVVADPQEPVPSGGLDEPSPHPNAVPSAPPQAAAPTSAVVSAAPSPRPADALEPPGPRALARDQDGAVLPSGRKQGELSEPITATDSFYIVTKNAGGDPVLHPDEWRLVVDGEVEQPFELDYTALRKLQTVEVTKTLECISNLVDKCELAPFGCDLLSTARWKGVRLSDVLGLVGGVKPGASFLATISADEFTTAIPLEVAMSPDALLVFEMNGQVLPREHGYPARVLIPGRYGMKSAKWVVALRPMRREFIDWYGQRQWSREAIVKTMTRIDVPARESRLQAGTQRISGVAYGGDRGIQMVEFSSDGGETWAPAEITVPAAGRDAWVLWQGDFTIASGDERLLRARATDGTGALQIEDFSLAQPDGATGWNSVTVRGE